MKNEEIIERLQDTEAIITQQAKRIDDLEKNNQNFSQLNIPDYSVLLSAIADRLDEQQKDDLIGQLSAKIDTLAESLKKRPLITRQLRILLFPENDQGQYYKIVFSRLIPWGLLFVVVSYLFVLGVKAIDAYGRNSANEQTLHYEKAWLDLSQHANKKTKAAMDDAYKKTRAEN